MFALVDCNNFYASCERVFRPDLNGQPVVVLSNNDGCVIARSAEAKALDIPMGAPAFKFQSVFDRNGVHVFSSNYALYGDMSQRVMGLLSTFSPEMEIYSIDEAFLSFDGFDHYDLTSYGQHIRQTITKSTGIPISLGFAHTKALTKVANRVAKKFPERTGGVYVLDTEEKRIKALRWLDVGDVWGIGRKHARRLQHLGVHTAYEFTQLPDAWVRKNMTVVGLRLKMELQGTSVLTLEEVVKKKTIATTRSFERMYTELSDVRERVVTYAVTCSEKLRRQGSHCRALMIFLHTNGFRPDLPQYGRNIVVPLPWTSNSAIELAKYAVWGLERIFLTGYSYKKAGVMALDLVPENPYQQTLFGNSDKRHRRLMEAMDRTNASLGLPMVKLASQDLGRTWKMRQEKLSPRYTTRLGEIIKATV